MTPHAALLLLSLSAALSLQAQEPEPTQPAWQKGAGPPVTFEVASVRQDKGDFTPPSFALSADDWFHDPKGRFHADFELPTYITFAYKIWLTPAEENALLAKLPAWVKTERFAIEATAPPHATKDQYRLMMQSLLADRFGLRLHFEQTEAPVFAMVLAKPGRPGPRLIPHSQAQPCDEKPNPETFPYDCYSYSARPAKDNLWLNGSRATTMDLLANFVGMAAGSSDEIGHRVVDRTGLTGLWDFTLEAPPPQSPSPAQPSTGPTMLEALQDQLGIKLKPARATISLPVIDHIDRPSEN